MKTETRGRKKKENNDSKLYSFRFSKALMDKFGRIAIKETMKTDKIVTKTSILSEMIKEFIDNYK